MSGASFFSSLNLTWQPNMEAEDAAQVRASLASRDGKDIVVRYDFLLLLLLRYRFRSSCLAQFPRVASRLVPCFGAVGFIVST